MFDLLKKYEILEIKRRSGEIEEDEYYKKLILLDVEKETREQTNVQDYIELKFRKR